MATKPDERRAQVAMMFAIVLGLVLGILIKRVRVGLLIGIGLGLLIVVAGLSSLKETLIMYKEDKDKVPFFKNWSSWYVLVIGFLIMLIILFYFFTKHFS